MREGLLKPKQPYNLFIETTCGQNLDGVSRPPPSEIFMKKPSCLVLLSIMLILIACNNFKYSAATPTIQSLSGSTFVSPSETNKTSTSSLTPTPLCSSEKILVSPDAVSIDNWSSDSRTLYYTRSDKTRMEYDDITKVSKPSEYHKSTAQLNQLGLFLDNLVTNGKIDIYDYLISPSGGKAIYVIKRYLGPTPTPPSEGESDFPKYINEIFIIDGNDLKPVKIGEISGMIEEFTWFPDEKSVIISLSGRYNPNGIYTWVADIKNKSLSTFYDDGKAGLLSVSPNNVWVLYISRGSIWARNLNSSYEYRTLFKDVTFDQFWWLPDGNRVIYIDHSNPNSDKIFIYDFQLMNSTPLSDKVFSTNVGMIGTSLLSPEYNKLAYIENGMKGLYIITLCLP